MNHDWHDWIDRLKSKDLTEKELNDFEAALREDPAHMDEYLDALLLETSLEGAPGREMLEKKATIAAFPERRESRGIYLKAAAAIAVFAAGSLCFLIGRANRGEVVAAPQPPEHVATITDADEAAAASGFRIGQPLEIGNLVLPENSKIGIAMRGGALLEVKGPANLLLEDGANIRLRIGRLSTYAPPYAHGFTINTEDGRIVDLGTRFVTAAGTGNGTEVHVVEGLVDAYYSETDTKPRGLTKAQAAILKDGELFPTEFLARRIDVPLDPLLPDTDGDGIPDTVEGFYGSNSSEAASLPELVRVDEPFRQKAGPVARFAAESQESADRGFWQGGGEFLAEGLDYGSGAKRLAVSAGALRTAGEATVGAALVPLPRLADQGVVYMSFLMRLDQAMGDLAFAGLLLYNERSEEMFVGKLSHHAGFGSRFRRADEQYYQKGADTDVHLYVIRIDRTRLVTDVFLDPVLGLPESEAKRDVRYQDVPEFDRISVRSGSSSSLFPATFDEIRIGLTWESVLPLAEQ